MAEEFILVEAKLVDMGNGPEVWIESNLDPFEGHAKIPAEKLGELIDALVRIQGELSVFTSDKAREYAKTWEPSDLQIDTKALWESLAGKDTVAHGVGNFPLLKSKQGEWDGRAK
jgi:hypothetical protein